MRGLTRRRAAVTSAVVLAVAVGGLWNQRRTIAEGAITNELARRGVKATYRVANIGLRWERLENIVIGDSRRPDLTADWAEVRVAATLGGLKATAIRAGGVRLRGRLVDGKISFGAIDKLLPAPSGAPFMLPSLDVDLEDARIALAMPQGDVSARLDGSGNLANGFRGKLAANAPVLLAAGCRADRARLSVDLAIADRKPTVTGPLKADSMTCGTTRLAEPALMLKVVLSEAFDHWQGTSGVGFRSLSSGAVRLAALSGWVSLAGDARATTGNAQLGLASGSHPFARSTGMTLDGQYMVRGGSFAGQGTVKAARVAVDQRFAITARAEGTPAAPLLQKLALAVDHARNNLAVSADLAFASGSAVMTSADVVTPQGMRLHVGGGRGVGLDAGGVFADTQMTLGGANFPTVAANFRRSGSETSGVARIDPYAAGAARLALTPVQFAISRDGKARVVTTATIDGPLGDGRVTGLRVPVALTAKAGDFSLNPGCTLTQFRALSVSGMQLSPATLRLCATRGALFSMVGGRIGGGASVSAPHLIGRLGTTPVSIAAGRGEIALSGNRFALGNLAVKLGKADRLTRLDLGALSGHFSGAGIGGSFAGLAGKIGNVPLLVDAGAGDWTLDRGVLALTGKARVSDEAKPFRFDPLAADDVKMRLSNGKIVLTGMLREPITQTAVSGVTITHDLGNGTGSALLDVAGIEFGKILQPERLTPLTLGVVANVVGSVAGSGQIDWNAAGVTSTGKFTTKSLDFAAAFGPVTGLSGDIVFTDLLGLVTAPGQAVQLAIVNPGIPVPDGRLTYHFAPNQQIVVEGGRWPFAGGALILDPTTLDMGVAKERRLTFRVEGLDAAKFIQQLELDNLSATGTFDGAMPMIFDDTGGRIVGGLVSARLGGGTLSYVGDVTNAKLNMFAKIAFDALKAIRYNNLSIGMDGALDGEIISKVSFRGVNEAPRTEKRGYFAKAFSNLPFIFNITIRAPFRGLLNTARTYQDPSMLLQSLPRTAAPVSSPAPAIQPPESGKRP